MRKFIVLPLMAGLLTTLSGCYLGFGFHDDYDRAGPYREGRYEDGNDQGERYRAPGDHDGRYDRSDDSDGTDRYGDDDDGDD